MANVFHKKTTKPVPPDAIISTSANGSRLATWIDSKGRRRTAPVSDGPDGLLRIVLVSVKWYGKVDGKAVPLTRDKRVSEQLLRAMETDALKAAHGIGPANPTSARKKLAEQLQDFEATLEATSVTPKHARIVVSSVRRVAESLNWRTTNDLDAETASRWLPPSARASTARSR